MKKLIQILEELERNEPGNLYRAEILSDETITIYNDSVEAYSFNSFKDMIIYFEEIHLI